MTATSSSPIQITDHASGWQLTCEQTVSRPRSEVFPFFAAAQNLERLTPGFLGFRITRTPREPLETGALIDYRLRLHGLPVWWRTRIDAWHPPYRFVDTQVRGPFRRWRHLHEFVQTGDGTLVRDTVDFDVYFRPLYRTPLLGWIESDLERIFEHRRRVIDGIFGPTHDEPDPAVCSQTEKNASATLDHAK